MNTTAEGMAGQQSAAFKSKGGSPVFTEDLRASMEEVGKLFYSEIGSLAQRVYSLERTLAKYERLFERAFQEELDNRTKSKQHVGDAEKACSDPTQSINRAISKGLR